MNDKVRSRLADCLEAALLINEWVTIHPLDRVVNDRFVESAYFLQFERIGETLRVVRDYGDEFEELVPGMNAWIGLRHRLVHDYREIDLNLLWTVATTEIPGLITQLHSLLD